MNEGFIFECQLLHSTDRVNPENLSRLHISLSREKIMVCTLVIIAIPKAVYETYITVSQNKNVGIEEVISITEPYYGDNDELIYTISPKHVLGYFNIKTSEFYQNRNWDPYFNNTLIIHPFNPPLYFVISSEAMHKTSLSVYIIQKKETNSPSRSPIEA